MIVFSLEEYLDDGYTLLGIFSSIAKALEYVDKNYLSREESFSTENGLCIYARRKHWVESLIIYGWEVDGKL